MKKLIYSLFGAILLCFGAMSGADEPTSSELFEGYLSDLKPQTVELSEEEKFLLPSAPLILNMGSEKLSETNSNFSYVFESDVKPWPSWWYPSSQREFFTKYSIEESTVEFQPSLFLYDFIFLQNKNKSLNYLETQLEPNASYSGACSLWALASIYEEQPSKTFCFFPDNSTSLQINYFVADTEYSLKNCTERGGEILYPGHQKALLALSYRKMSEVYRFFDSFTFGQINQGSGYTDMRDIYPHELIQLLQFQLGKNKFPLIVDIDLSEAVWNHPVYRAELDLKYKNENTLSVLITLDYVLPLNQGLGANRRLDDMVGILNTQDSSLRKLYRAELYGRWNEKGSFVVDGQGARAEKSAWVKESINDHPDIVMAPPRLSSEEMMKTQMVISDALLRMYADSEKDLNSIKSEINYFNIKSLIGL